jgi:hypothetical protein
MQQFEITDSINTVIKQQRITILCILRLPEAVKESTPLEIVKQQEGDKLLCFSYPPSKGELFPYESNIWKVISQPIQQPSKYYSKKPKHPTIIFCDWVCGYNSINQAILGIVLANN